MGELLIETCPKCGVRTFRGEGFVPWCRQCQGAPPKGEGFEVLIEGRQAEVNGPILDWRVSVLGPDGEIGFRQEGMSLQGARKLADGWAQTIRDWVAAKKRGTE
jgi:hypothetical protein